MQPSNSNLKAIVECTPPKSYTEVCTFLGLVGHYRRFSEGLMYIVQPLNKHLTGEGANRKSEQVTLSEDALKTSEVLKQVCMTALVLAFADYQTIFVGDWCIQRWVRGSVVPEADGQMISPCHLRQQSAHAPQEKLPFDKAWVFGTEVGGDRTFQGVPALSTFPIKTYNNPLTYIMLIPNLNATSHQWVGSLAWFNFELEYQKGCDNNVADVLSWVTTWLDPDTVRSILNGVALGAVHWAKVHKPTIVKGDLSFEQEVHVATGHMLVQMHVTDWAKAQREDPILSAVLDWLKAQKKTDLKALLADHASSMDSHPILQINRILQFIREPCICAQCPRARPKIFYFSWS